MALQVEIEGRWPWQRCGGDPASQSPLRDSTDVDGPAAAEPCSRKDEA